MPITLEMMQKATAAGLSAVCATCEKYWKARDRGIPDHRCLGRECGSPMAGDYFHEYEGRMTAEAMERFCFVCGSESDKVLTIPTKAERRIGVCLGHLGLVFELAPITDNERVVRAVVRGPNGAELLVSDSPRKRPRLLELMIETEKEWADRFGYEFDPKNPFRT